MKKLALPAVFVFIVLQLPIRVAALSLLQTQGPGALAAIGGTVSTVKGVPVPGAAIRVVHVLTGSAWETSTDLEGKFFIRGLPSGSYRIEAHQLGLGEAVSEQEITTISPA